MRAGRWPSSLLRSADDPAVAQALGPLGDLPDEARGEAGMGDAVAAWGFGPAEPDAALIRAAMAALDAALKAQVAPAVPVQASELKAAPAEAVVETAAESAAPATIRARRPGWR